MILGFSIKVVRYAKKQKVEPINIKKEADINKL
jgi:hypothetical protein